MEEQDFKILVDKLQDFNYDSFFKKAGGKVKKPGILVCGGTGTGKSSLINRLFGEEVALTGNGKAVSDRVLRYEPDTIPVVLYDTKGYEVGRQKEIEFKEDVIGYVEKKNKAILPGEHVHLSWYCISAGNKRIKEIDLEIIKELSDLTKVCVLLTQIDTVSPVELKELKDKLHELLPEMDVFALTVNPAVAEKNTDWDKLTDWALKNLEGGLRLSLAQALGESLRVKRMEADALLKRYVAAAAGAVVCPLPMTDSAALIAIQTAMATHLFNFWGIDRGTGKIRDLFVNMVVANTGRIFSRTLLKLIPCVGTLTTVIVNGGVATSFTWAFGKAVNEACFKAAQVLAKGGVVDFDSVFALDTIMQLVQKYYEKSNGQKQNMHAEAYEE